MEHMGGAGMSASKRELKFLAIGVTKPGASLDAWELILVINRHGRRTDAFRRIEPDGRPPEPVNIVGPQRPVVLLVALRRIWLSAERFDRLRSRELPRRLKVVFEVPSVICLMAMRLSGKSTPSRLPILINFLSLKV